MRYNYLKNVNYFLRRENKKMKIKKFIVYIMAAVFAAAIQPCVFAETGNDAIIVVPWYSDDEESESEPVEVSDRENDTSDPDESENTESSTPDSTADTTALPPETSQTNDPFNFEEPDESSDTSDSSVIQEETTTEEPQISLDTAPPTEETTAEPPTETEPPVTETTTETVTEAPTETEESTPEATETTPSETEPPAETTTEERENTTSPMILPPEGGNGAGPVEGDPDGFITTILLIAGAIVLFVLILTVPPIFRKIRKNIIYKYD